MKKGKMSSVLLDYKKQAFYEEHPEMELITPEHTYTIQLFAGYVANVQDDAWQIGFSSTEEYEAWIERAIERSYFER